MNTGKTTSISILLLRLGMACFFLYAGFSKVLDPSWSAAGYLGSATTFPLFYQWFAQPGNIGWVDLLNEWSIALVGIALALGLFVRFASFGGILLMALYYFPVLEFPFAGTHALIVDEHVIYALVFILLITSRAGMYWGVDSLLKKTPLESKKLFRLIAG